MNRSAVGASAFITTLVVAAILIIVNMTWGPTPPRGEQMGLCLNSPDLWFPSSALSGIVNTLLILVAAPAMLLLNKRFNFVRGESMLFPSIFLMLTATNVFITPGVCSSTILLVVNLICLALLFDTASKRNATQDFFIIATLISIGSMCQYAFLPMIPAFIIGGLLLRKLNFKELMAFGMGLVAPYWAVLGLGIVSISDFHLPVLKNIFSMVNDRTDLFMTLVETGLLFLVAVLLCMNNAMRLYAGNSGIRLMNNTVNTLGFLCALCMMVDFDNLFAYVATLNFWIAVQFGNLYALYRLPKPGLLLFILSLLLIAIYVRILIVS
ncbi:MAG: hypothetical protein NC097_07340 [Clostridium sp.]|nr:hypothetical protein [Prevotella sp.]MCM1429590.1 hypothetical protein [Clostridium sp.]MCM1476069.1 hypothetical protein [Muribaculaceae bacterium]